MRHKSGGACTRSCAYSSDDEICVMHSCALRLPSRTKWSILWALHPRLDMFFTDSFDSLIKCFTTRFDFFFFPIWTQSWCFWQGPHVHTFPQSVIAVQNVLECLLFYEISLWKPRLLGEIICETWRKRHKNSTQSREDGWRGLWVVSMLERFLSRLHALAFRVFWLKWCSCHLGTH